MSYSVSSGFQSTSNRQNAPFKRTLTIAGSDYSNRVVMWPQFQNLADRINIDNISMTLAGGDQVFSSFPSDQLALERDVVVKLGFDYTVSSTEYMTLFSGKMDSFRMVNDTMQITAVNKFAQLASKTVGSITTPTNYTGSDYAPSDLAWYIATSHGGLSALTTSANPDIDYPAFTSWTAANSAAPMLLRGRFQGERAIDLLERVARTVRSSVLIENGKLKFILTPSTPGATTVTSMTYEDVEADDILFDKRSVFNRYYVGADLDVTSQYFKTTVVAANSASVNSFGARDSNLWDKTIWHANSTGAQRLADFVVSAYGTPKAIIASRSPLSRAFVGVGDTVTYTNSHANIRGTFVVDREGFDMESGRKSLTMRQTSPWATPITLDLDFAAMAVSGTLDPRISYARSGPGAYYTSSGFLAFAADNVARLTYDPASLTAAGIWCDPTRSNLLLWSESFSATVWGKTSITVSADIANAPTNSAQGDAIFSTITGNAYISQNVTLTASTAHTLSFYFKGDPSAANQVEFGLYETSGAGWCARARGFLTGVGSLTVNAGVGSGFIESLPNSWYRLNLITTTFSSPGIYAAYIFPRQNAAANSGDIVYAYGAQLEVGDFPTGYIPTSSTTVVRSFDLCQVLSGSFTAFYNQSEGTIRCHGKYTWHSGATGSNRAIWSINDGTANNRHFQYNGSGGGGGVYWGGVGGVNQFIIPDNTLWTGYKTAAAAYKLNDILAAVAGTLTGSDTSASIPTCTRLELGGGLGFGAGVIVNRFTYYPYRTESFNLSAISS